MKTIPPFVESQQTSDRVCVRVRVDLNILLIVHVLVLITLNIQYGL